MLRLPHRRLLAATPSGWSPLLLGPDLIGWFDAGSWSSLTIGAGGAVSGWTSLVDPWTLTQPVASAQPTYVAAQPSFGNRPVLSFDAADQLLRDPPPVPIFRNRTGGTIAAVLAYASVPATDAASVFVSVGSSVFTTRAAVGTRTTGTWGLFARRLDADGLLMASAGVAGTAPVLTVAGFNWAAGTASLHVNGAAVFGGPLTSTGTTSDTQDQRVAVGLTPLAWTGGLIAGVLLVGRVLTPEERMKWEGYEAHRYGFAGTLPADHPHRSAPPRATLAEREALADRMVGLRFADPALRAAARATIPLRRPVPGWRAAA